MIITCLIYGRKMMADLLLCVRVKVFMRDEGVDEGRGY